MITTNRLTTRFDELRARGEAALIGYLMTGDPDVGRTLDYARALEFGGVDILELGVPYSDPIADGPVISAASQRALRQGVTLQTALQVACEFRQRSSLPVVLMTYYNPVFRLGEGGFAKQCSEAGVDGVIIPDLPLEEAASWGNQAQRYGLARIFLVTPETKAERAQKIAQSSSGFLYLVSRYGTTGVNEHLSHMTIPLIERIRPLLPSRLRLAVGFGFSARSHIESVVRAGADGVIVGSALVAKIAHGISPEALSAYVRELKDGTKLF